MTDDDPSAEAPREFTLSPSDCMVLGHRFCLREGIRESTLLQGPAVSIALNETATEILRRCEGPCSVAHIVEDLKALYVGVSNEEIEKAVRDFLESAYRKGWIRCVGPGED
jgi:pyrroloquinoline quinone biosynthesis protein D